MVPKCKQVAVGHNCRHSSFSETMKVFSISLEWNCWMKTKAKYNLNQKNIETSLEPWPFNNIQTEISIINFHIELRYAFGVCFQFSSSRCWNLECIAMHCNAHHTHMDKSSLSNVIKFFRCFTYWNLIWNCQSTVRTIVSVICSVPTLYLSRTNTNIHRLLKANALIHCYFRERRNKTKQKNEMCDARELKIVGNETFAKRHASKHSGDI